MISDAVKLKILDQYQTLAREKSAFEATLKAFVEKSSLGFDRGLFLGAIQEYHDLYTAAEQLGALVLVYFPWAFEQFASVFQADFAELLKFHVEYAELFKELGTQNSCLITLPSGSEYETFRLIAAVASSSDERKAYQDKAGKISLGSWDERRLEEFLRALASSSHVIPVDVRLSDPFYSKFRDSFLVEKRRFAVIIGSGATINVSSKGLPGGMPDWNEFVSELIGLAARYGNWSPDQINNYKQMAAVGRVTEVAQVCRQAIGDYWGEELEKFFAWPVVEPKLRNTSLYRNLAELPFSARLTTNYDSAYERINNVDSVSGANLQRALFRWQRGQWQEKIVKLHGNVDSGEVLIVGADDYMDLYGRDDWYALIKRLFESYQVLFIGFGLNDDRFNFFVSKVGNAMASAAPEHLHYTITEQPDDNLRKLWNKNYRLQVIPFPKGQFAWTNYYIQDLLDSYRKLLKK